MRGRIAENVNARIGWGHTAAHTTIPAKVLLVLRRSPIVATSVAAYSRRGERFERMRCTALGAGEPNSATI